MKTISIVAMLMLTAAMPLVSSAQPVKAAYVDDVGEGRRVPFSVTVPLRDFLNCATLPAQCQSPVPAGKRFVIENIGAYLQISVSGTTTGDIVSGFYVNVSSMRTYFPFTPQAINSLAKNWAGHFPFRAYLDEGQLVQCTLNGSNSTGSPSFSGECVLAGYLIDKR